MEDLETWLARVYAADGDHATLQTLYDEWASDYDQQLWASGNPYIAIAAGFTGRLVQDFDARILDAGCGTGNMAQILTQMGYRNIDGLDPSAGMLAVARNKQLYRQLHRLYLEQHIALPESSYDAVVAAGVLTHGHAPPEALDGNPYNAWRIAFDPDYKNKGNTCVYSDDWMWGPSVGRKPVAECMIPAPP